jgi:hypothetical protein
VTTSTGSPLDGSRMVFVDPIDLVFPSRLEFVFCSKRLFNIGQEASFANNQFVYSDLEVWDNVLWASKYLSDDIRHHIRGVDLRWEGSRALPRLSNLNKLNGIRSLTIRLSDKDSARPHRGVGKTDLESSKVVSSLFSPGTPLLRRLKMLLFYVDGTLPGEMDWCRKAVDFVSRIGVGEVHSREVHSREEWASVYHVCADTACSRCVGRIKQSLVYLT